MDLKLHVFLKQIDLKKLFQKFDKEGKGVVSIIQFKYILNGDLELPVDEVENIVNFFILKYKDSKVLTNLKVH